MRRAKKVLFFFSTLPFTCCLTHHKAGLFEIKAKYDYTFENENAEKRKKEKTFCCRAFQKHIRKYTNKTVA